MTHPIDTSTYNKSARYPVGHGYSKRPGSAVSIVVHSTEGAVGQTLSSAANYIYTSTAISAHYLIGKQGEIIQFLDPHPYAAWHAGNAQDAYLNEFSIGIECLHAKGEPWPAPQLDALAWLLQQLCSRYAILNTLVDTHGQVAIAGPYIRKIDPTNWAHADFVLWRDQVLAPRLPCIVVGLPVYQRSDHTGPLWGYLTPGQTVVIDDPSNGHVCELDGQPAGIGFVDMFGLDAL